VFKKILIANRGEIAVRIVRACRELGISTVAVYSSADADALHRRLADQAICIGPPVASESYLNIPNIISAAELTGVDAIHPGYGFLAENAEFADVCRSCDLVFIGPSGESIRAIGNKAGARRLVKEAGVPVLPGSDGPVKDEEEALRYARSLSYPVMIKASAGGGGRGMRIAATEGELLDLMRLAQREASASFGNGEIYFERYLVHPRHVEVQVLGDGFGNLVHLGERDCTIQRRHQKLIEEAPSPALDEAKRRKMGEAAVRAARAVNYVNAGTVEFLLDGTGEFFFIEMNTRVQVEHPVTEMVTGIDIVKEQIRIAAGERLDVEQDDVALRGHAIEFRINAEDPERHFAPAPGEIRFYGPPGGPGVRVDTHIFSGYRVPAEYDSLLAKLIVWGRDRDEAIARGQRALSEMVVVGPPTTIPFHRKVLEDPSFRAGDYAHLLSENPQPPAGERVRG